MGYLGSLFGRESFSAGLPTSLHQKAVLNQKLEAYPELRGCFRILDREAPVIDPEVYVAACDRPRGLHGVGPPWNDHRTIHGVALLRKDVLRAPARAVEGELGALPARARLRLHPGSVVHNQDLDRILVVRVWVWFVGPAVADGLGGVARQDQPLFSLRNGDRGRCTGDVDERYRIIERGSNPFLDDADLVDGPPLPL